MSFAVQDRLISYPEVAEALGISPRTVAKLAAAGYLKKVPVLGSVKFRASDVARIVREGTAAPPGQVT